VARSILQLDKLPAQQLSVLDVQWQDDVLRYGQKIRLLAHPAAQVTAVCQGCKGSAWRSSCAT
jgi:hypothetical protein